ncbi:MAG: hypothetical protein ACE14L_01795 [Terriglobales bacterium]
MSVLNSSFQAPQTASGAERPVRPAAADESARGDQAARGLGSVVILVLSIVLGLIPLVGIGWIIWSGWLSTVDGLFMGLILLTLSGILLINPLWEARKYWNRRKKAARPKAKQTTAT